VQHVKYVNYVKIQQSKPTHALQTFQSLKSPDFAGS